MLFHCDFLNQNSLKHAFDIKYRIILKLYGSQILDLEKRNGRDISPHPLHNKQLN